MNRGVNEKYIKCHKPCSSDSESRGRTRKTLKGNFTVEEIVSLSSHELNQQPPKYTAPARPDACILLSFTWSKLAWGFKTKKSLVVLISTPLVTSTQDEDVDYINTQSERSSGIILPHKVSSLESSFNSMKYSSHAKIEFSSPALWSHEGPKILFPQRLILRLACCLLICLQLLYPDGCV